MMHFQKNIIIGILGAIVFIFFSYAIYPKIVKFILIRKVWLKKGSFMRRIYDDMPFPIDFNVYLFNITNPDEVASGELPKLQEVGPYRFREWKKRIDQSEDNTEDSLTYTLIDRFELIDSNGLTGQETIVMPHMIIMSTLVLIKKDREPMLPLVSKALETIFKDPNMIFMTATAMDIMFNGLLIKCDSEDFGAKAFCVALETEAKGLEMLGDRKFAFSLFGLKNRTDSGVYSVKRGIKNIKELGKIITYNEESEMDTYDGDSCNEIRGTDATIFPPMLSKTDKLWSFTPDICRSLGPHYLRKSKVTGIPTGLYSVDFTIDKNNSEELCYCSDPPDECPEDGTMDLQPCLNAPIVATKPYFLGAPESYSAKMNLNPLPHKHDIIVHLDPVSGIPLDAIKRIQLNLEFLPVDTYVGANNLQEMLVPLFWIEEGIVLKKPYTNMLKYQLHLGMKFNTFLKIVSIMSLIGAIIYAAFIIGMQMKNKSEADKK